MAEPTHYFPDGTVAFLPHRLNRQPVVVRGLTADELWICVGVSACTGLAAGIPLAWLLRSIAVVPTVTAATVALGVFLGGGWLRRKKRGRPDTWLHRRLHWHLARRHPALASTLRLPPLITRSGRWSTRRGRP
ncbi:TIGR03750 family conjugal transfer protein [Pseudomonas huaxiensis]|uniref:TIGR03750 family conjugal transfer protein n=1 Tax=Pseudomonas huaxiensis TaxID=2213017 RepID=UPI000DA69561|nr:TIGR03750 family conjugal transfer protein [Pseudomonas huaxiensis]